MKILEEEGTEREDVACKPERWHTILHLVYGPPLLCHLYIIGKDKKPSLPNSPLPSNPEHSLC